MKLKNKLAQLLLDAANWIAPIYMANEIRLSIEEKIDAAIIDGYEKGYQKGVADTKDEYEVMIGKLVKKMESV